MGKVDANPFRAFTHFLETIAKKIDHNAKCLLEKKPQNSFKGNTSRPEPQASPPGGKPCLYGSQLP
ncbi:MAG: hypothetical protein JWR26_1517 [Pedosphaera sp.]|nr:hypothetical protein [Pedosphaera sp.]